MSTILAIFWFCWQSSFNSTMSPNEKFCFFFFHIYLDYSLQKNSFVHLLNNSPAMFCSCCHFFCKYASVSLNSPVRNMIAFWDKFSEIQRDSQFKPSCGHWNCDPHKSQTQHHCSLITFVFTERRFFGNFFWAVNDLHQTCHICRTFWISGIANLGHSIFCSVFNDLLMFLGKSEVKFLFFWNKTSTVVASIFHNNLQNSSLFMLAKKMPRWSHSSVLYLIVYHNIYWGH